MTYDNANEMLPTEAQLQECARVILRVAAKERHAIEAGLGDYSPVKGQPKLLRTFAKHTIERIREMGLCPIRVQYGLEELAAVQLANARVPVGQPVDAFHAATTLRQYLGRMRQPVGG